LYVRMIRTASTYDEAVKFKKVKQKEIVTEYRQQRKKK